MQRNTLNWVIWNAILAIAIYLGNWQGMPNIGYAVAVFVWLMLGFYLLVLHGGAGRARPHVRPVPRPLEVALNVAFVCVFIESGWLVSATAYALSALAIAPADTGRPVGPACAGKRLGVSPSATGYCRQAPGLQFAVAPDFSTARAQRAMSATMNVFSSPGFMLEGTR